MHTFVRHLISFASLLNCRYIAAPGTTEHCINIAIKEYTEGRNLPELRLFTVISSELDETEEARTQTDRRYFRLRLEQMLDQRHALYHLASKIDWSLAEQRFGGLYTEKGLPGIPIRLMVGVYYPKHAFNESDKTMCSVGWRILIGNSFVEKNISDTHCRLTGAR